MGSVIKGHSKHIHASLMRQDIAQGMFTQKLRSMDIT